jgi:hypothetical protein
MQRLQSFAQQFFAVALLLVFTSASRSQAAEPELTFDFGRTLACRDVTSDEFSKAFPDERVVECTLRLSVHLTAGAMDAVGAVRVEITDCDARLRVHDFSPRTRLESEFSKDIETTKTVESSHSLSASLGGEIPAPVGGVLAHVTPTIGGGMGGKEIITEKQTRVAPRLTVVASGTMNEEHGVFFTLRPSAQSSLEGVHELTVQFIVPLAWRGDAVRISCQATGEQKVLWMKQQKVFGEKSMPVALYVAGDSGARRAADRFARQ